MLSSLFKPEYFYRPSQIIRRVRNRNVSGFVNVRLPWGATITVSANDNMGGQVVALGLYDLALTEALWRLCEPGEVALDVGANIGYTVNVIAEKIKHGTIHAFEPHPEIFKELAANVTSLQLQGCTTNIHIHQCAIGRTPGKLPLHVPADFQKHRGESSLAKPSHLQLDPKTHLVEVDTLASRAQDLTEIGTIKIDVEGFELEVLNGGSSLFEEQRVRDCVFEEHLDYPTPVTDWFAARGYAVFRIERKFSGPLLLEPDTTIPRTSWTATNYLATKDPSRAKRLFQPTGWRCLRNRVSKA